MTLQNKYTLKIKKLYKEAEKLGYIPNTIEVSKDELRDLINELCKFKDYSRYQLVHKDRREDGEGNNVTASMSTVFLQHRPNEVSDMIINELATLIYRDKIPFVIKDEKPQILQEDEKPAVD